MNKSSLTRGEKIEASVKVTNTGNIDGDEIVQLYIHDRVGDVTRPLKELKGYRKVNIKKGETVTVSFTINMNELSYYHQDMSYSYDPGEFDLYIGPDSSEGLTTSFSIL